jgi:predicted  nucleic acid-binding Zn-ribbon protein
VDASRETLKELLELQKIDSTIDRLEARRRNLPEQAELDALADRLASLERAIGEQQAVVDEIARRQHKLEGEIDMISAKIEREEGKLYGGEIANPKELSDLQEEVVSLKRRRSNLEDQDLEVMEEREQAEKELAPLLEEAKEVRNAIEAARNRRDHANADLIAHLNQAKEERTQWAPKFDPELLGLYDSLRASKGGVGAAALTDGVCQGCHMRLPAQEYERVRKSEGLIRCDECRRILVVV